MLVKKLAKKLERCYKKLGFYERERERVCAKSCGFCILVLLDFSVLELDSSEVK